MKFFKEEDVFLAKSTIDTAQYIYNWKSDAVSYANWPVEALKTYNQWTSGSQSGSLILSFFDRDHTVEPNMHLFDIAIGLHTSSAYYADSAATNKKEKNRIYRLFAKHLLGDEKKTFSYRNGTQLKDVLFFSFRRNLYRDEILKKTTNLVGFKGSGTFPIVISPASASFSGTFVVFGDSKKTKIYSGESSECFLEDYTSPAPAHFDPVGILFHEAGILAVSASYWAHTIPVLSGVYDVKSMLVSGGGGTLNNTLHAFAHSIDSYAIKLVGTEKIKTTYFTTRALNDEFNYSSNPTFTNNKGQIVVTSGSTGLKTRTYITRIGLLGKNGEVLAVANIPKPIRKDPDTELAIKVRLNI